MLLGDLVPSGIEALRVLLESPAQSGLLADGPDHGMKLDDPVRVLPPGSPVGGLVDIGAEGSPAAALTRKLPGDRLVLEPAPRVSCRRPGERRPIPGQRLGHQGRDVPLAVHPGAFRSVPCRCSLRNERDLSASIRSVRCTARGLLRRASGRTADWQPAKWPAIGAPAAAAIRHSRGGQAECRPVSAVAG